MFNYLFPIFCFGLVMTGIVFLGIIEAARQVKAESVKAPHPETPVFKLNTVSPRNSQSAPFAPAASMSESVQPRQAATS